MKRSKLPGVATWTVFLFAIFCGGFALCFGWIGYSEATKEEFYVNLSTSLGSIAITVLVIDQLNRWRIASERKREIIEQMGSPVNDAALEAVRQAGKNRWLTNGSLKGAYLGRANLQGAMMERANLQNATLSGANLRDAELTGANLQGAYLTGANLQGAYLLVANLQGADLMGANLQDTKLSEAKLQDADLMLANLQDAKLSGANLQGAYLMLAKLQGAYLGGAQYNSTTTWPAGFDPVAVGARLVGADSAQSETESPA